MKLQYISRVGVVVIGALFLRILCAELFSQSYNMKDQTDGIKSDTNAVENIRLIPVVYSQEALDYHSGQRSDRTVPTPATTAQGSSGSLTATASESFHRLTSGDPLSHIPLQVQVNTDKRVGSIPVESSVTPSGGISYSIPVACLPGRNGFQPGISIAYNSMGSNSVVGFGWGIAGISTITRSDFTMYYEGTVSSIQMNTNDPFVLDGNRILKTSTYGQWETEQGKIKVVPVISGSVIKYFNVYYPNGVTAVFGLTNNTINQLFYPITKLTDLLGNSIEFNYVFRNNHYYINNIQYGKNTGNPVNFGKIQFTYKTRTDISSRFHGGQKITEDYLLDKIECYSGSEIIHTYSFTYIVDKVSLLDRVDCDNLNPLTFYYGYSDNVTSSLNKTQSTLSLYFGPSVNVILNKGKFDYGTDDDALMVYPLLDNAALYSSGNTRYYYSQYSPSQQLLVYQSLADAFPLPVLGFTAGSGFMELTSSDYDGRPGDEVVRISNTVVSDKDRVTFNVYQPNLFTGLTLAYTRYWDLNNALSHSNGPKCFWPKKYYSGDFNGDGRMDMLCVSMNQPLGQADKKSKCTLLDLFTGTKLYDAYRFDFDKANDVIIPMDYDGDGKTDICLFNATGMHIYSFNVSGTVLALEYTSTEIKRNTFISKTVLTGDLNADGKPDIIVSPEKSYYSVTQVTVPVWSPQYCPHCGIEYPVIRADPECRSCRNYIEESWNCIECGSQLGMNCGGALHSQSTGLRGSGICCETHGENVLRELSEFIDNGNQWVVYYGTGNKSQPYLKEIQSFLRVMDTDKIITQDIDQDGAVDI